MPRGNCCIPGCSYAPYRSKEKRSLFTIRRPDCGKKSAEQKQHFQNLTNCVLGLRDASKGDKIKSLLHRESAAICEAHFKEDDIICYHSRKELKVGAVPSINLPKQVKVVKNRKEPAERAEPPPTIRHSNYEHLKQKFRSLPIRLSEQWSYALRRNKMIVECHVSETSTCSKISVCFLSDLKVDWLSFLGCRVDVTQHSIPDIRTSTLLSFLDEMGSYSLCKGLEISTLNTYCHTIQEWNVDTNQLSSHVIIRSPSCSVVVKGNTDNGCCNDCGKYDVRTKYNQTYATRTCIPELKEDLSDSR